MQLLFTANACSLFDRRRGFRVVKHLGTVFASIVVRSTGLKKSPGFTPYLSSHTYTLTPSRQYDDLLDRISVRSVCDMTDLPDEGIRAPEERTFPSYDITANRFLIEQKRFGPTLSATSLPLAFCGSTYLLGTVMAIG